MFWWEFPARGELTPNVLIAWILLSASPRQRQRTQKTEARSVQQKQTTTSKVRYFCISHISSKTFAFHIFLCNFDTFFFHYLWFKLDWGKLKAERFTAPSTKAYISLTLVLEKNDFESEAERFLKGPPLSDFLSLGEARNGTAAFTQNIYSYFYQLDRDRSWETSKEVLFDRNCILLYSLFYHILCKKNIWRLFCPGILLLVAYHRPLDLLVHHVLYHLLKVDVSSNVSSLSSWQADIQKYLWLTYPLPFSLGLELKTPASLKSEWQPSIYPWLSCSSN